MAEADPAERVDVGELVLEAVLAWLEKNHGNPDPANLTMDLPARSLLARELVLLRAGAAGGVEARERLHRIHAAYRSHGTGAVMREVATQLGMEPAGQGRKLPANPVAVSVAYLVELWKPDRHPSDVTREMQRAAIGAVAAAGPWKPTPTGGTPWEGARRFLEEDCRNAIRKDRSGEVERSLRQALARLVYRIPGHDPARPEGVAAADAWVDWFIQESIPRTEFEETTRQQS
jgi:hypothetical protein